jgi:hypothetical protein
MSTRLMQLLRKVDRKTRLHKRDHTASCRLPRYRPVTLVQIMGIGHDGFVLLLPVSALPRSLSRSSLGPTGAAAFHAPVIHLRVSQTCLESDPRP